MDFSAILDFCKQAKNKAKIKSLFAKAYRKNRENALYRLILLYSNRLNDSGRICVQYLVDIKDYEAISIIAGFLGYLGHWDELVAIMAKNTKTFDIGMEVLKEQFARDLKAMESGKTVSRMARWIPSVSINNNPMANQIAEALGYTPDDYHEIVVELRSCIERPKP